MPLNASALPVERLVQVRGLRLNVREWPGTGRPFLLVHGLSANARTWDGVALILYREGYRVAAVDQRGHGLSDKPDDGYSFDEVTADLHELIGGLGLKKPVLAGQSGGGGTLPWCSSPRPRPSLACAVNSPHVPMSPSTPNSSARTPTGRGSA